MKNRFMFLAWFTLTGFAVAVLISKQHYGFAVITGVIGSRIATAALGLWPLIPRWIWTFKR